MWRRASATFLYLDAWRGGEEYRSDVRVGAGGDFFLRRGKFLLGKSPFTEANFREILQNLGTPPLAARHLLSPT